MSHIHKRKHLCKVQKGLYNLATYRLDVSFKKCIMYSLFSFSYFFPLLAERTHYWGFLLGVQSKALYLLGRCSTIELYTSIPQILLKNIFQLDLGNSHATFFLNWLIILFFSVELCTPNYFFYSFILMCGTN